MPALSFKDSVLKSDSISGVRSLALITNIDDDVVEIKAQQDIVAGTVTFTLYENDVEVVITNPLTFNYDPNNFNLLAFVYEPGYVEMTVGDGTTTISNIISKALLL